MAEGMVKMPVQSAVFCRVEGALVAAEPLFAAAWCAANSQRLRQRAARIARLGAGVLLDVPALVAGRATSAGRVWGSLRGVSEDRMIVLGSEYGRRFLLPQISAARREMLTSGRPCGMRLVLVSAYIDAVLAPIADLLQANLLLCNRLEYGESKASGRLCAPIVDGLVSKQAVQDFAAMHQIDLKNSIAYGVRMSDGALFNAVGQAYPLIPEKSRRSALLRPQSIVQT